MNHKKAELLIVKFFTDSASEAELQELTNWLEDSKNETYFKTFVKVNFAASYNLEEDDYASTKKVLIQKIRSDKSIFYKNRFRNLAKYAAAAILLLGTGYFFKDTFFAPNDNIEQIVLKDNPIILESDNGTTQVLNPSISRVVQNNEGVVIGKQDKNVINYSENSVVEKLSYNTLKVPYGKQFNLILSDGTRVFLNSETSLKYPIRFLPGQKREVVLTGEAFFDVEQDKTHPFIVNAEQLDVTVLGTQFVVSLYKEDRVTSVVLVEGAVDLTKEGNSKITSLTPGTRGVLDDNSGLISKTIVNTNNYTAWMQGLLIFRNETFENIARKLERVYNVTIVSDNKVFNKEVFNASFNNEPIENILSYFKDSYNISYTIENDIIYIKNANE